MSEFKSGFAAILGRPNVGKSTLLNTILGQKIVIATDKAQTTRKRIKGIFTNDEGQIVFIDTPGIHKPLDKLGEFLIVKYNDGAVKKMAKDGTILRPETGHCAPLVRPGYPKEFLEELVKATGERYKMK